ncbi:peptidase G1 [Butyriboletus roseoflavus]|nr:peptidase G1 [Butyriboletus roseoflavus]
MAYVFANTTTSIGSAIIHNLSIRQIVSIDFEFSQPLCDYIAEWLVEDYMEGSNLISFANFGNVQFTSAIAFGAIRYNYSPSDGDIFNIQQNSQLLTSVTIDTGNSVLVQYI